MTKLGKKTDPTRGRVGDCHSTGKPRLCRADAGLDISWMFVGPSRCESTTEGYRAYRRWGRKTLREDVELFENQILYLIQIRKLKNRVFQEQRVTITEEEMQQVFLKDKHHVGGELVVFALTILSGSRAEIFPYFLSDLGLIRHLVFFVGLFVIFCPFLSLRMTSQLFKIP